jgi:hypothetical protein
MHGAQPRQQTVPTVSGLAKVWQHLGIVLQGRTTRKAVMCDHHHFKVLLEGRLRDLLDVIKMVSTQPFERLVNDK